MNTLAQLIHFQKFFLPILEKFFAVHRKKTKPLWPLAEDMFERLVEFTLRGGKRTRSAILYYSYQGFSDENPKRLLPVCIACELMQVFLLIHDDIMDQSEIRRGGQTIHLQYPDHKAYYGESMAILIGNLAGYLGVRSIASSQFAPVLKTALMDLYAQICIDAGYGQALDISLDTLSTLTEENIYTIYHYKTARYTTEFPLLTAALLAGVKNKALPYIKKLGVDLGILFQLKDDILGLFGDEQIMGKQTALDLVQGKKTLLVYKAFEKSNKKQRKQLLNAYGNLNATPAAIACAKEVILETGAVLYAEKVMEQRSQRALNWIEKIPMKPVGKMFLRDFVYYCSERVY